jgi:uncharacterized membrane protein
MKHLNLKIRVLLSIGVAILAVVLLPPEIHGVAQMLCIWDAGIISFLGLTGLVITRATPTAMRHYAKTEDEGRWFIFSMITAAACASLVAIGSVLKNAKGLPPLAASLHVILAIVTIVGSWLLIHTIFALQYAHEYYQPNKSSTGYQVEGLDFPSTEEPDYWDFLYFSFVIGMTSQVSDVSVTSRQMRRLSLLHGILAFFFNTSLLALSINILASLI